MRFENFAVNSFFTLICSKVIFIFVQQNFRTVRSNIKSLLFITSFAVFNGLIATYLTGISFIVDNIAKPILILSFSIYIIHKLLYISVPNSIISFCIMGVGLFIGNAASPVICNILGLHISPEMIKDNIPLYILSNIIATIISVAFILLIYPIRHVFTKTKNNKLVAIDIVSTFIIVVICCSIQGFYKGFDWLPFSIISLITITYTARDIWKSTRFYRQERIKMEFEQQKFYNAQLEGLLSEMRRFKHDWSNTLSVLQSMIKKDDIGAAGDFISEIVHSNQHILNTALFNIKNAGLFGIVYTKLGLAAEKEIKFSLNVIGEIKDIPNMKISELCEIIGIFLDNSIEAAEKSNEKDICMTLKNNGSGLEMEITNTCSEKPIMSNIFDEGYSTKGANRGNGLHIVKNILKKHDNILLNLNYNQEENEFVQCMVIS